MQNHNTRAHTTLSWCSLQCRNVFGAIQYLGCAQAHCEHTFPARLALLGIFFLTGPKCQTQVSEIRSMIVGPFVPDSVAVFLTVIPDSRNITVNLFLVSFPFASQPTPRQGATRATQRPLSRLCSLPHRSPVPFPVTSGCLDRGPPGPLNTPCPDFPSHLPTGSTTQRKQGAQMK